MLSADLPPSDVNRKVNVVRLSGAWALSASRVSRGNCEGREGDGTMPSESHTVPRISPAETELSLAAYQAATSDVALRDRSPQGRIEVTGEDRRSWLQGLLSNDIAALTPGAGCYATYLTPQGRMISDMRVLELGSALLLDVPSELAGPLVQQFDQLIFAEDARVADVTARDRRLAVYGPSAARTIAQALAVEPSEGLAEQLSALPPNGNLTYGTPLGDVLIARSRELGINGFDLYVASDLGQALLDRFLELGAVALDENVWNVLRIEHAVPLFGQELDTDTLPLEAGIEDEAISFTKGCYVGQEIIIRVMHRGHGRVARRLVGLVVTGETKEKPESLKPSDQLPIRAGDSLVRQERKVGRVTSAAWSPRSGRTIAMGYVYRDDAEIGTELGAVRDQHQVPVVVHALPFIARV